MSALVQSREFNRLLERIRSDDGSLRVVNVVRRRIGDDGCRRLAEALRGNTRLTRLDLRNNSIDPAGATALAGALEGNASLTVLDSRNNSIGPAGATALAGALEGNSTLTGLWLSSNNIGREGAAALAGALEGNTSLTELGLDRNSVGDDGAAALAGALEGNTTLTYLNLTTNRIGPEGAAALAGALEVNTSLTALSLWLNNIGPLEAKVERLVEINRDTQSPQEAHRLKVECRIGWMLLDSEDGGEEANYRAAMSLALNELDSFPQADRRHQLFEKLLGSTERGVQVAASVDVERGRALYRYAADCGASPVVMMNVLKAHPSLSSCRDVEHKLYPFMLLSAMEAAGAGEVLELLLMAPELVKSGINGQTEEGSED